MDKNKEQRFNIIIKITFIIKIIGFIIFSILFLIGFPIYLSYLSIIVFTDIVKEPINKIYIDPMVTFRPNIEEVDTKEKSNQ